MLTFKPQTQMNLFVIQDSTMQFLVMAKVQGPGTRAQRMSPTKAGWGMLGS